MGYMGIQKRLSRSAAYRRALWRNMVTSLFEHERIRTTVPKAKQLRRLAERLISYGKRGDLHARRRALTVLRSDAVAGKLFGEIAERFRSRNGGYTRIYRLDPRPGDAAPMAIIELLKAEASPDADRPKGKRRRRSRRKAKEGESEKGSAASGNQSEEHA